MSSRMDEVERTEYQTFILGQGNQLVQPRTHKKGEPSREVMADQLVQFNYTKRDEFHAGAIVVVKTVTSIWYTYTPGAADLVAARARLDKEKARNA